MTFYVSKKTIEDGYERFKRFNEQQKPSFKEHQEFMRESNRAMWKQYIKQIKESNQ